jgi:hypothetical protein
MNNELYVSVKLTRLPDNIIIEKGDFVHDLEEHKVMEVKEDFETLENSQKFINTGRAAYYSVNQIIMHGSNLTSTLKQHLKDTRLEDSKVDFWAYLHSNNTIQVKRWFGDVKEYTEDCENNPFVRRVFPPFKAFTYEEACEIASKLLTNK